MGGAAGHETKFRQPNIHGTTLSHATNRMRQIAPCMIAIRRDFCLTRLVVRIRKASISTRLVVRIRKASISTRLVLGNFKGRPPFPRRFLNLLWNFLAILMIQAVCARSSNGLHVDHGES